VSFSSGQELPLPFCAVIILLVLSCVPPPQLAEQVLQLDQSLTTQSTGQISVLHAFFSFNSGHGLLPLPFD
jgi:hypothetical protein